MEHSEHIAMLLRKALQYTATPEEYGELADLIGEDRSEAVTNQIEAYLDTIPDSELSGYDVDYWNGIGMQVLEAEKKPVPGTTLRISWLRRHRSWWAAAVLLLLLVNGIYFWPVSSSRQDVAALPAQDILPGGNKAVLTLADGSRITLDSAGNGAIAMQGNTQVIKSGSGQLIYQGAERAAELSFNTLSTPRGGQYRLVLPDGSKVWLNAASSIYFPTAFTGKERQVRITGEAFFEVVRDPGKPFTVYINQQTAIQVLGTSFNINAYPDEVAIQTTLLEGAVKVTSGHNSHLLKPGQQAVVEHSGEMSIDASVSPAVITAWRNGIFHFQGTDLPAVLRQIGRWYDVEILYEGDIPEEEFSGKMQRDLTLSQVLRILEKSDVHFRIEGKKIIVTK